MNPSTPHSKSSIAVDQADDLSAVVGELVELVEDQQEQIAELRQEVEDLRADQADHRETTAERRAEDRKRLTDVEDRIDDVETADRPQGSTEEDPAADGPETPQTALERTASLPAEMIDDETANVRRAVFLARDAQDYTRSVPAGRAITAGEIARVLRAGTDCNGHSQTVDRVIRILDEMGQDEVQVVDRRGQRRVVFSDAVVSRLERLTQAAAGGGHGVVTGGSV